MRDEVHCKRPRHRLGDREEVTPHVHVWKDSLPLVGTHNNVLLRRNLEPPVSLHLLYLSAHQAAELRLKRPQLHPGWVRVVVPRPPASEASEEGAVR